MIKYVAMIALAALAVLMTNPVSAEHKGPCHGAGCGGGETDLGPKILLVTVDLDFDQIVIEGEGFLPADIDPEVTLAAGAPLNIVWATESTIEADLPDLAVGDYLLEVTAFDGFGVAVGSEGYPPSGKKSDNTHAAAYWFCKIWREIDSLDLDR